MRRHKPTERPDQTGPGITGNTFEGVAAVLSSGVQQNIFPAVPVGVARVVPMQLRADVKDFTGRSQELAELDRLLAATDGTPMAAVISAVSGTAGVGKTALALRWAHRVRNDFADGQLYVDLRGFDPNQPFSATDALAGFLRALGVAGQDIPVELEECAAAYRSLVGGRRMLIVLDNASSVEQVRPLLPGSPSCVVVVTSRDSLAGLVARHGAHRLDLDLLPHEDAIALLAVLIGERVAAEPDAAATLAELCARLPLALRVAAELAADRATTSLAQLVSEFADEKRRLELLEAGGDPRTAVRAVFSWSYQHLPTVAARVFRLIGLHPGPDFDPYAVAALAYMTRDHAQQMLNLLSRAHLIQSLRRGRYGMHDLLRVYAADLATVEDSQAERVAALTRLFDYYLATATAAMDVLIPAQRHRRPRIAPPGTPIPLISDPATARPWLDAEGASLAAMAAYTAAQGWPGHTTRLATTLYHYLEAGGRFPNGLIIHTHALYAARHTGEPAAEADALLNLGAVHWLQGHQRQAIDSLQQVLTLAREIGDQVREARALLSLGLAYWQQGHQRQAIDSLQRALTLAREIGDQVREARALASLGAVYRRQGHYQQATDHYQQALTLGREIGDRVSEARALAGFGAIYRRQGHYQQATDHYQQALALFREVGDRHGEAHTLNCLGQSLLAIRQPDQALAHHTAALALAVQIGQRYEQAHAHDGIAHIYQAARNPDQARHHWRHALALYTDLGVPNGADVHAHLTALDQATG